MPPSDSTSRARTIVMMVFVCVVALGATFIAYRFVRISEKASAIPPPSFVAIPEQLIPQWNKIVGGSKLRFPEAVSVNLIDAFWLSKEARALMPPDAENVRVRAIVFTDDMRGFRFSGVVHRALAEIFGSYEKGAPGWTRVMGASTPSLGVVEFKQEDAIARIIMVAGVEEGIVVHGEVVLNS